MSRRVQPKFLSTKISKVHQDVSSKPEESKKKKRKKSEGKQGWKITDEELKEMGFDKRERSKRAKHETLMEHGKGKKVNYRELQARKKKMKEFNLEQEERDKELGGGIAIIKRTREKKKKQSVRGINGSEGRYKDGELKVSRHVIQKNTSSKKFAL